MFGVKNAAKAAAARGKSTASRVAGSKMVSSATGYAKAHPGRTAAMGVGGAMGFGAISKRRGPGVSKTFANGKRATSIYKY